MYDSEDGLNNGADMVFDEINYFDVEENEDINDDDFDEENDGDEINDIESDPLVSAALSNATVSEIEPTLLDEKFVRSFWQMAVDVGAVTSVFF